MHIHNPTFEQHGPSRGNNHSKHQTAKGTSVAGALWDWGNVCSELILILEGPVPWLDLSSMQEHKAKADDDHI